MNKKIGKNAKLLIASDLIYNLTAVFIETFFVAYFFEGNKRECNKNFNILYSYIFFT